MKTPKFTEEELRALICDEEIKGWLKTKDQLIGTWRHGTERMAVIQCQTGESKRIFGISYRMQPNEGIVEIEDDITEVEPKTYVKYVPVQRKKKHGG